VRGGTDELHNPQVCVSYWLAAQAQVVSYWLTAKTQVVSYWLASQTQVVSYWLAAQTLVIICWLAAQTKVRHLLAVSSGKCHSRLSLAVSSEEPSTLIVEAVSQKLSSYKSSCHSVVQAVFQIRIDPH
jgi:hypothetical protein